MQRGDEPIGQRNWGNHPLPVALEWPYANLGGRRMSPLFIAGFCYSENNENVQMAGLADHQFETQAYILFQKTTHPTAQDREMGLDQVHVTVNDEAHSCYGGVNRVILQTGSLLMKISQVACKSLGTEEEIVVAIPPKVPGVDNLAEGLQKMLGSIFSDER
jgi:hypothetical protein